MPRRSSLRFSQLLAGATTPTVSPSRRRAGLRGASSPPFIATSYEEARHRVRFEEDRAVDPETLDLGDGRGSTVDDELREDPAEDRGELEGMGGAQGDQDVGLVWQAIDDEIPIRRQRVEAGLRHDLRAEMARQVARQEVGQPGEARLVPGERPGRGRRLVAADVLGRLG